MPTPKLFLAAKAFVAYQGKLLIIRESTVYKEGTQQGKFDVPGGRLKPGEDVLKSLACEVNEETGLAIAIGPPFFINESWPVVKGKPWQIVRVFFLCRSRSNRVRLGTDHDHYKWIDPKIYRRHAIIKNLLPAFQKYLELSSVPLMDSLRNFFTAG